MPEAGAFALFLAVGAIGVALLVGPVGQAVGRLLLGKRGDRATGLTTGEMTAERVGELEARIAELEASQGRLLELEERVEFAERLLAGGSDVRPGAPPGGSGA
jgi:hypothetical protein